MVEKPSHADLLGSQTVISSRNEIDKSPITQKLKLLTYFGPNVLVARIEVAQMLFESVDVFKREVALPE